MEINGKYYSESELKAYVKEQNRYIADITRMLRSSMEELHKLGYEDCFSCVYKGSCSYKNDCQYRWEYADKAERLLNGKP